MPNSMPSRARTAAGRRRKQKPSAAFGTQTRKAVYRQANVLGTSKSVGYTPVHSYSHKGMSEHDSRRKTSSTHAMAKATREGTSKLHWANTLGTTVANTTAMDAQLPSNDLDRLTRLRTPNATFGRDVRESILKQNNELGVPLPSTVTATVKYVDHPISKVDSRFKTAAGAVFAKSLREDSLLLVDPQNVPRPSDRSDEPMEFLLKHPEFDSTYKRVTSGAPFHKSTTKRDDVFKQYNVMACTVPVGRTDNVEYTLTGPVEASSIRKRTGQGLPFSKITTQRKDYQRQANVMGLNFPKYDTANIPYPSPRAMDKLSNRPTAPSTAIAKAPLNSINEPQKLYNDTNASMVKTLTSNAEYGDNLNSDMDSRFRKASSANFGSSTTTRDDLLKQFNSLNIALPHEAVSEDKKGTLALLANALKKVPLSRLAAALPKGPSANFGTETRETLYTKRNNELNTTVPVGRTDTVRYVEHPISRMDSRFPSSRSTVIGDGPRYIPGPRKTISKTPMLTAEQVSSFRRRSALGKGTWSTHEFGITKRDDIWKQANLMRVPVPFARNDNDTSYVSPNINARSQSKFRRAPGINFGASNRQDAILQHNVLGVKHPPHPNRIGGNVQKKAKQKTYRPKNIKPPRVNRRPVFANGDIIMDKDCESFVNVWKRETLRRARRQQRLEEERRELEEERAAQELQKDPK